MAGRRFALYNLGCKVNQYETDAMGELLEKAGYEQVPFSSEAEIFVINTCSVTNMADRKSRQIIHRARKLNPRGILVACGCYTQTWEKQDADVDIVLGNNRKNHIVEALAKWFSEHEISKVFPGGEHEISKMCPGGEHEISKMCPGETGETRKLQNTYRDDISHAPEYEPLFITRTSGHTRAFIKVQDGCNQFCSYCIIPYARGRIRSRDPEDVLEEVKTLAENGFQEVVLTGIHLSSYGRDKIQHSTGEDGRKGTDTPVLKDIGSLMDLIEQVQKVEGITRIRLGSLEPRVITEEFVRRMDRVSKLCHHFHLSLQSGCDKTLKAMNRHYLAGEFKESCELIRKYWPDAALTTDVIVGFPGENDEDFSASKAFVDSIDFYETHIFKYSRRHGTRADRMPDQVDEACKTSRSNELLELNKRKKHAFLAARIGISQEMLAEEILEIGGMSYVTGHTKEYCKLLLPISELSDSNKQGNSISGKIFQCIPRDFLTDEKTEEEYLLCEICII